MIPRLTPADDTLRRAAGSAWTDPRSAFFAGGGWVDAVDLAEHEVRLLRREGFSAAVVEGHVVIDVAGCQTAGPRRFPDLLTHLGALHAAGIVLRNPRPASVFDGARWRFVDFALASWAGRGWPFATTDAAADLTHLARAFAGDDATAAAWAARCDDDPDAAYEACFGRPPERRAPLAGAWVHAAADTGGLADLPDALVRREATDTRRSLRETVARLVAAADEPAAWGVLAEVLHVLRHLGPADTDAQIAEAWRRSGADGLPDWTGHAAWFDAETLRAPALGADAWTRLRHRGPAAAARVLGPGDVRAACALRLHLDPRGATAHDLAVADGGTLRWVAAWAEVAGHRLPVDGLPRWLRTRIAAVRARLVPLDPAAARRAVDPVAAAWRSGAPVAVDVDPPRVAALAVLRADARLLDAALAAAADGTARDRMLVACLGAAADGRSHRAGALLRQAILLEET